MQHAATDAAADAAEADAAARIRLRGGVRMQLTHTEHPPLHSTHTA